jgi:PAS domain S-box-containing protein
LADVELAPISRIAPRRSVRTLLVWLILAALFPGVIAAIFFVVDQYHTEHDKFEQDTLQIARALVQAVDSQVLKVQTVAETLAGSAELESRNLADFHRRASALIQGTTIGSNVVLCESDGQQIVNTLRPFGAPLPVSPVHTQIRQLFASGQPFVSDMVTSKVTGKPTMAVYVPVRAQGRVVYALGVGILQRQIQRILVSQGLPEKRMAAVFDGRGTIVARTHASDKFVGMPGNPALVQRTREVTEGSIPVVTREGIPVSAVFSRSPLTNWTVVIAMPDTVVDAEVTRTASLLAGVLGLLFSAGLALAWFVGGRIKRSVQALTGPAVDLESGHPVRIPVVHFREADEVAKAMASTARILRRRTDELAEASDALIESETRMRGIFESATDAILSVDETLKIVMANPAAGAMFQRPVDQLIGAPLEQLISLHPDLGFQDGTQSAAPGIDRIGQGGVLVDVVGTRANGQLFPASAAGSHLRLGGQNLLTVILRDITERHRMEEALQASNAMLDAALSSMSDAVFISDPQGRLIRFNEAYASFHRFTNKQALDPVLSEYPNTLEILFASGEPVPRHQWPLSRGLRGEAASGVEYQLRRKDTGETWFGSYSFSPIRSKDDAIVGAVVSARDVTAIKQTQADLESSHATLKRLISIMDGIQENERRRIARELHDELQQLLAAIKVYVNQIAGDPHAQVSTVLRSVGKLAELTDTANIAVRRIINDLRPQILEYLGLVPALEALAEQFQDTTGIRCRVSTEGEKGGKEWLPQELATCLYRVAQEALNNVAKYAHASQVGITVSRKASGEIVLALSDNGLGFSQIDKKERQTFGLLGMRERVHAIGGTLDVQSQTGIGTTIQATIPPPGTDGKGGR